MRTLIIHNPLSGFGSDAMYEFTRQLARPHDEIVLRILDKKQDSAVLLEDVDTFDCCVLSGGDSTIVHCMKSLLHTNTKICIIPSGMNNLFATNIGSAPEPAAIAKSCIEGTSTPIDLAKISYTNQKGEVSTSLMGVLAGTGYDSQIVQSALPNKKTLGQVAYLTAILANPLPPVKTFKITVDGKSSTHKGISCIIANGSLIQGEIDMAPGCSMNDGYLDVVMVEVPDAVHLIKPFFASLFDPKGKLLGRPSCMHFTGKKITVECLDDIDLQIDMEHTTEKIMSFTAEVIPSAVNILCDLMSPYYNAN